MSTPADLQVFVGREDVSAYIEELVFSAVDPGGFESQSFSFPRNVRVPRGTPVKTLLGQSVAWDGRISNVNRQLSALPRTGLTCQGHGSRLKDNGASVIFVDRDQSQWKPISRSSRIQHIETRSESYTDGQAVTDVQNGLPALLLGFKGAWSKVPASGLLYDAGAGNTIAAMWTDWVANVNLAGDGNSRYFIDSGNDDSPAFLGNETNLRTIGTSGTGYQTCNGRFVQFIVDNTLAPSGTEDANYELAVRNPALYGNHGLTRRGADPGGFYPDDIVRWVIQQAYPLARIAPGIIESFTSFVIPHLVYYTPVNWEQMIDDVAKFCGFHYGTWEGTGLDQAPRFDFRSRPTAPNTWISRMDCDDLSLDDAIDTLYNVARVTYHDTGGSSGTVAVTRGVPGLDETGTTRTLYIDMGVGSSAAATAFGNLLLAISALNASTTGSFKTKGSVLATGGGKPACLLRPGLERIKITDLTADGFEQTEFAVKRFEANVSSEGIDTTVELGIGTNFLDVLQSQLAVEAQVLGLG